LRYANENKPQYLVSWQIYFGLHLSFNITTILAVLKLVISPTYSNFERPLKSFDIQ